MSYEYHTNEALVRAAAGFEHRVYWKKQQPGQYQAAQRRGLLNVCCAHMKPKASPYSGDYIIYAYEFSDRHVYVGLTFRPQERHAQHMVRGRVFEHIKKCTDFTRRTLEESIGEPAKAALREKFWLAHYEAEGWTLLNKADGGGLGTVQPVKWTRETVLAEALKYPSKQAWIDGSQTSYRIAKREGWFKQASAHMPARVLGVGAGLKRSQATRDKLSRAAQKRADDPEWRKQHSAALKGKPLTEAHKLAIKRGMATPSI